MKYFKVTAKCGHVGGPGKYILNDYFTIAECGKEAAARIRFAPRVKHDHKDAIRSVVEITREEYIQGQKRFNADPYNHCVNPQEQKLYWDEISPRVLNEEVTTYKYKTPRQNAKRSLRYGYSHGCPSFRWDKDEFCA